MNMHTASQNPPFRLNVGCGRNIQAGWLNLDSSALPGVDIVCDLEQVRQRPIDLPDGSVEMFLLSHVIEHMHDPLAILGHCYTLLKLDGFIWISTPNLNALGHMRYKSHWRGLEPPRHLVLFTPLSLTHALRASGFTEVSIQPYTPLCKKMFSSSQSIKEGKDPYVHKFNSRVLRREISQAERVAKLTPELREFITLKAWKRSS